MDLIYRKVEALANTVFTHETLNNRFYEDAGNHPHLNPSNDNLHEHCKYFYIPIGEAEQEHELQTIRATLNESTTEDDVQSLAQSFIPLITITACYWQGIYNAMPGVISRTHAAVHA